MTSYSCPKCEFIIEKYDEAWEVAMQMRRCPECYTKLPAIINLNPQDTTNASNEESALDSKPKSKPLLIIIVLLILAFGIAIMIDDDHELDRGLVKVIFKVLFYGVEALLSISK